MGTRLVVNPLDGSINAYRADVDQASRVVLTFSCLIGTVVGDVVYQDPANAETVLTNINNTQVKPSIGIVISKPNDTTCEVLILGILSGFSGLSIGDKVWLATNGSTTSVPPTSGYRQVLGVAVAPDTMFIQPTSVRVLTS